MITEQYVSFETAQMLKEEGFDIPCNSQYTDNGFGWNDLDKVNYNEYGALYSRPTQSLAARWLREVHKIAIILTPISDGWMYDLYDLKKYQYIILSKVVGIVTYEAAFEEALQETLRLIIKNKGNEQRKN